MGDDDVICISSDDDETNDVLHPKKSNVSQVSSVKKETTSPGIQNRDLKRKSMSTSEDYSKKRKTDKINVVEEITIVSPCKDDTNKSSIEKVKNIECQAQKFAAIHRLENNKAVTIEKGSARSSSDSSRSSHEWNSNNREHTSSFNRRVHSSKSPNHKYKESRSEGTEVSYDSHGSSKHPNVQVNLDQLSRARLDPIAHCSKETTSATTKSKSAFIKSSMRTSINVPQVEMKKMGSAEVSYAKSSSAKRVERANKVCDKSSEILQTQENKSSSPNVKIPSKNDDSRMTLSMHKFPTTKLTSGNRSTTIDRPTTKSPITKKIVISETSRIVKTSRLDVPGIAHETLNRTKNSCGIKGQFQSDNAISKSFDPEIFGEGLSYSTKHDDRQLNRRSSATSSNTLQRIEPPNSGCSKISTEDLLIPSDNQSHKVILKVSKNSNIGECSKIESSRSMIDKNSSREEQISSNSTDNGTIVETTKSLELEIVTNNSHCSNDFTRKPCVETCELLMESRESENSVLSKENTKRQGKDCAVSKNSNVAPNTKTIVAIPRTIDGQKADENRVNVQSQSEHSKLPLIKKSDVVIKRILPNKIILSKQPTSGVLSTRLQGKQTDSHESSTSKDESNTELLIVQKDSPKFSRSKDDSILKLPVVRKDSHESSRFTDKAATKFSIVQNDHDTSESRAEASSKLIFEPTPGCSKTPDTAENETSKLSIDSPEKPCLIEKTRKPIVPVNQDTFAKFLSLCQLTDRGLEMEKVIAKLKRHYELLDPEYATSRSFERLLDQKRDRIKKGTVYYYIGQVIDEMKLRRRQIVERKIESKEIISDNAIEENVPDKTQIKTDEVEDRCESRRLKWKIRTIEKTMKKCTKRIRELETAEVDFSDENNSHYIKLDRYKEKMVELYAKICEYTNEQVDAGRAYLRPKNLRVTQIPSIDKAINSFINSKLSCSRRKRKKPGSFVDGLVFPDYNDILECVAKVNKEENLGYDKRKQQSLAESAFTQLGKHLQNARQKDYWDTFAFDLENDDDPAIADPALAEKLLRNQEIGEKKIKEVFEEYVKKQEEGHTENHETSSSEDDSEYDQEEDEHDNDGNHEKNPNCVVGSDVDRSEDDDTCGRSKMDDFTEGLETTSEIYIENKKGNNNNIIKMNKTSSDAKVDSSVNATKNVVDGEPIDIEDNTEGEIKELVEDQQRPLRIRSFAKPPSSWASSQEIDTKETRKGTIGSRPGASGDMETIDVPDEDPKDIMAANKSMDQPRITSNSSAVEIDHSVPIPRLTNGNGLSRPNVPIFPRVQAQSHLARGGNQMRNSTATSGAVQPTFRPLQILPRGQLRLQMTPNLQTAKSQRPQLLRLQNARVIRASAAVIRPLSIFQSQQLRDGNSTILNDKTMNTLSTQIQRPTILHIPRYVRVPEGAVAAVAAAARSSEIPQLRVERIENAPQGCQKLSNVKNTTVLAVTQGNLPAQRTIPAIQAQMSDNPQLFATHSKANSAAQKTWWLPPDVEPPCKK